MSERPRIDLAAAFGAPPIIQPSTAPDASVQVDVPTAAEAVAPRPVRAPRRRADRQRPADAGPVGPRTVVGLYVTEPVHAAIRAAVTPGVTQTDLVLQAVDRHADAVIGYFRGLVPDRGRFGTPDRQTRLPDLEKRTPIGPRLTVREREILDGIVRESQSGNLSAVVEVALRLEFGLPVPGR
jgi:hypothetical protein